MKQQLAEEDAYKARNAVYEQQDKNQSVTFTSSQYLYAGTYGGNQSERLKKWWTTIFPHLKKRMILSKILQIIKF